MSVTPKPFNAAEKIKKSIFAGRPSVYSAEDINRLNDVVEYASDKLWSKTIIYRDNWYLDINTINETAVSGTTTLALDVSVKQIVPANPAYVHALGIRFDMPLTKNLVLNTSGPTDSCAAYLYLIAEKNVVDFATNPTLSGINSTEFPHQLPSSDTVTFGNERLELVNETGYPTLSGTEMVIGIVACFINRRSTNGSGADVVSRYIKYNAVLSDLNFDFGSFFRHKAASGTLVQYKNNNNIMDCLLLFKDFFEQFRTRTEFDLSYLLVEDPRNAKRYAVNDFDKQQRFKQSPTFGTVATDTWTPTDGGNLFITNNPATIKFIAPIRDGLCIALQNTNPAPFILMLDETPLNGATELSIKCAGAKKMLNGGSLAFNVEQDETILLHQINGAWWITQYADWLENYVQRHEAELVSNCAVPIGGVIPYRGSLSNFDPGGKGVGSMFKWALCNGNNGTYDMRGRFIVGAHAVNNLGAPTLDPEVDPGTSYAGKQNPTYGMGGKGGEPHHALTIPELAKHSHVIDGEIMQKSGSATVEVAALDTGNDTNNGPYQENTQDAGQDQAHNNLPPYLALAYIQRIL